jgi:cytochrome c oxidase assembly protein subunit 15
VHSSPLSRLAWATVGFNVAVVLFGAVVRATGSGAGCGSDWPVCRGSVVPFSPSTETLIEFTHRATSGVALVLVIVLAMRVMRSFPAPSPVRTAALASGVLIVVEALIGAGLVIFEWVGDDASVGRAVSTVLHLANTFLLLGALTLTALWLSGRPAPPWRGFLRRPFAVAAGFLVVTAALGAIAALGDTLFPPEDLGAALERDLQGALLERLRWLHPVVALVTAGVVLRAGAVIEQAAGAVGRWVRALVLAQIALGVVNVVLLAPLWMQVVHLLAADLLWITFVAGSSEALASERVTA